MSQMFIYIFLTIVILFGHYRWLKMANFENNVTFSDRQTDRRTIYFLFLTYIDMTHVNFLVHRLLVGETQTDRQTRQICNRYIHLLQIYLDKKKML